MREGLSHLLNMVIFSTWSWSFFLSLWGKGGKGIWTFSDEEREEEEEERLLEGEGSTNSEESFFLSSSFLHGDSREEGVSESLGTPSVASPNLLDEPVSGGEEEEEFSKNW